MGTTGGGDDPFIFPICAQAEDDGFDVFEFAFSPKFEVGIVFFAGEAEFGVVGKRDTRRGFFRVFLEPFGIGACGLFDFGDVGIEFLWGHDSDGGAFDELFGGEEAECFGHFGFLGEGGRAEAADEGDDDGFHGCGWCWLVEENQELCVEFRAKHDIGIDALEVDLVECESVRRTVTAEGGGVAAGHEWGEEGDDFVDESEVAEFACEASAGFEENGLDVVLADE